jgi:hypothetical protein
MKLHEIIVSRNKTLISSKVPGPQGFEIKTLVFPPQAKKWRYRFRIELIIIHNTILFYRNRTRQNPSSPHQNIILLPVYLFIMNKRLRSRAKKLRIQLKNEK